MIPIDDDVWLRDSDVTVQFSPATGPGGQNVNKVASAVRLMFDAVSTSALSPDVLVRLRSLAGRRMTAKGIVIIEAQRYRTQERNKEDALQRLVGLIRSALEPVHPRTPTRPSFRQKAHRVEEKRRRSMAKKDRAKISVDPE